MAAGPMLRLLGWLASARDQQAVGTPLQSVREAGSGTAPSRRCACQPTQSSALQGRVACCLDGQALFQCGRVSAYMTTFRTHSCQRDITLLCADRKPKLFPNAAQPDIVRAAQKVKHFNLSCFSVPTAALRSLAKVSLRSCVSLCYTLAKKLRVRQDVQPHEVGRSVSANQLFPCAVTGRVIPAAPGGCLPGRRAALPGPALGPAACQASSVYLPRAFLPGCLLLFLLRACYWLAG